MSFASIIAAISAMAANAVQVFHPKAVYRAGTYGKRSRIGSKGLKPPVLKRTNAWYLKSWYLKSWCPQSNKTDNLPRGYPGAKFDRKCARKMLGIRNITHTY